MWQSSVSANAPSEEWSDSQSSRRILREYHHGTASLESPSESVSLAEADYATFRKVKKDGREQAQDHFTSPMPRPSDSTISQQADATSASFDPHHRTSSMFLSSRRRLKSNDKRASADGPLSVFSGNKNSSVNPSGSYRDSNLPFLGNAGILGAGFGDAAGHSPSPYNVTTDDIPSAAAASVCPETPRKPLRARGKSLPDLADLELLDPEILPRRAVKPGIDPEYHDLLPLPPTEPSSPKSLFCDSFELPALPESRPNTPPKFEPESRRRSYTERGRKNSILNEPPVRQCSSPTAVPVYQLFKSRRQLSNPSSPAQLHSSPVVSPLSHAAGRTSEGNTPLSARPHRIQRPLSYDGKEIRPFMLHEILRHSNLDVPDLPPLPPSVEPSETESVQSLSCEERSEAGSVRSSSLNEAEDIAQENTYYGPSLSARPADLRILTDVTPATYMLDDDLSSSQSTPRAGSFRGFEEVLEQQGGSPESVIAVSDTPRLERERQAPPPLFRSPSPIEEPLCPFKEPSSATLTKVEEETVTQPDTSGPGESALVALAGSVGAIAVPVTGTDSGQCSQHQLETVLEASEPPTPPIQRRQGGELEEIGKSVLRVYPGEFAITQTQPDDAPSVEVPEAVIDDTKPGDVVDQSRKPEANASMDISKPSKKAKRKTKFKSSTLTPTQPLEEAGAQNRETQELAPSSAAPVESKTSIAVQKTAIESSPKEVSHESFRHDLEYEEALQQAVEPKISQPKPPYDIEVPSPLEGASERVALEPSFPPESLFSVEHQASEEIVREEDELRALELKKAKRGIIGHNKQRRLDELLKRKRAREALAEASASQPERIKKDKKPRKKSKKSLASEVPGSDAFGAPTPHETALETQQPVTKSEGPSDQKAPLLSIVEKVGELEGAEKRKLDDHEIASPEKHSQGRQRQDLAEADLYVANNPGAWLDKSVLVPESHDDGKDTHYVCIQNVSTDDYLADEGACQVFQADLAFQDEPSVVGPEVSNVRTTKEMKGKKKKSPPVELVCEEPQQTSQHEPVSSSPQKSHFELISPLARDLLGSIQAPTIPQDSSQQEKRNSIDEHVWPSENRSDFAESQEQEIKNGTSKNNQDGHLPTDPAVEQFTTPLSKAEVSEHFILPATPSVDSAGSFDQTQPEVEYGGHAPAGGHASPLQEIEELDRTATPTPTKGKEKKRVTFDPMTHTRDVPLSPPPKDDDTDDYTVPEHPRHKIEVPLQEEIIFSTEDNGYQLSPSRRRGKGKGKATPSLSSDQPGQRQHEYQSYAREMGHYQQLHHSPQCDYQHRDQQLPPPTRESPRQKAPSMWVAHSNSCQERTKPSTSRQRPHFEPQATPEMKQGPLGLDLQLEYGAEQPIAGELEEEYSAEVKHKRCKKQRKPADGDGEQARSPLVEPIRRDLFFPPDKYGYGEQCSYDAPETLQDSSGQRPTSGIQVTTEKGGPAEWQASQHAETVSASLVADPERLTQSPEPLLEYEAPLRPESTSIEVENRFHFEDGETVIGSSLSAIAIASDKSEHTEGEEVYGQVKQLEQQKHMTVGHIQIPPVTVDVENEAGDKGKNAITSVTDENLVKHEPPQKTLGQEKCEERGEMKQDLAPPAPQSPKKDTPPPAPERPEKKAKQSGWLWGSIWGGVKKIVDEVAPEPQKLATQSVSHTSPTSGKDLRSEPHSEPVKDKESAATEAVGNCFHNQPVTALLMPVGEECKDRGSPIKNGVADGAQKAYQPSA